MPDMIEVYYQGFGERWLWGRLITSTALTGRPMIAFEYSEEAIKKGLELSRMTLPLNGPRLRRDFPPHQLGLPGPVYDALPDGWGMLLMDRLFKRRGLNAARVGPLERLTYIGDSAMGAMTFHPVQPDGAETVKENVPLAQLAAEVQAVLSGEGGEFLQTLLQMGGSPQGARPKVLLYRDPQTQQFTTVSQPGLEAWLVKFPAQREHPEVCASAQLQHPTRPGLRYPMGKPPLPVSVSIAILANVYPCKAWRHLPALIISLPVLSITLTSCAQRKYVPMMFGKKFVRLSASFLT